MLKHIALASNIVDTAPGVGPAETTPDETTHFGVEFLSSSVSKGNLDERVKSDFGLSDKLSYMLMPTIQFIFETILYDSNDHLKYFETVHHGYGILDITQDKVDFSFQQQDHLVAGVASHKAKKLTLKKNKNKFEE
mmetsp:Transcript_6114/g.7378  ORF Transcript_6114/g.7378 Transcript_6114/m.7378 type:complete len:136 (+) Transcript_6114:646-1053(+)